MYFEKSGKKLVGCENDDLGYAPIDHAVKVRKSKLTSLSCNRIYQLASQSKDPRASSLRAPSFATIPRGDIYD